MGGDAVTDLRYRCGLGSCVLHLFVSAQDGLICSSRGTVVLVLWQCMGVVI